MTLDAATVRLAEPKDLPACSKIINDWIDETDWMPRIHSREEISSFFAPEILEQRHFLVAVRQGTIAGYLSLDSHTGFIHGLYVAPQFRGAETGQSLLDAAKKKCPDNLTLFTFQENEGAQRFYTREGFEEVLRTDGKNKEKLPDIKFGWNGSIE